MKTEAVDSQQGQFQYFCPGNVLNKFAKAEVAFLPNEQGVSSISSFDPKLKIHYYRVLLVQLIFILYKF